MYNPNFPAPNFSSPYTQPWNGALSPQNSPQRHEIIHVNGKNGVDALQMAPNSNILVLDDTAPIVWLCQTDGAGYKTATPYSITPYKPDPPVDLKSLEERIARLEGRLNDKSNFKPNKSRQNTGSDGESITG